jgi:hypothetical protein
VYVENLPILNLFLLKVVIASTDVEQNVWR